MIRVKGYIIIMQQSNGDVSLDEVSDRDPKKIMSLSIIKCGIVTIHAICWYVWILIAKTNTSCEKRYMSTKQHPSSNTTIYRLWINRREGQQYGTQLHTQWNLNNTVYKIMILFIRSIAISYSYSFLFKIKIHKSKHIMIKHLLISKIMCVVDFSLII